MVNLPNNPASTLEAFSNFATQDQLSSVETYMDALKAVIQVLPQPGGLLHLLDLPTIIIPDLHARREMLIGMLEMRIIEGHLAGQQVFELLQQGCINVICLGDIVHSEKSSHWIINRDGKWTPELLEAEMVRSLGAGAMIMYLKLQYPAHFHCLRGNHDDMAVEFGPYRKYVGVRRDEHGEEILVNGQSVFTTPQGMGESGIVKNWILTREGWGQTFLDAWSQFESALPLLAQASYYVMSHTLPNVPISEDALHDPDQLRAMTLTLTSNRKLNSEAIENTLDNLGIKNTIQRWFYGHTPVPSKQNDGKYQEDLDGLVVRLNNPEKHIMAYVPASDSQRLFDPNIDVSIIP